MKTMVKEITELEKIVNEAKLVKQGKQKGPYLLWNVVVAKQALRDEEFLAMVIEDVLEIKVKKITYLNTEMSVETLKERRKILDLLVLTDQGYIAVEINYGRNPEALFRNYLYKNKTLGTIGDKVKSYADIRPLYQINFIWNLQAYLKTSIKGMGIVHPKFMLEETYEVLFAEYEQIFYVDMDYFEKIWYTLDVKEIRSKNKTLMYMSSRTYKQMSYIGKGDKLMNKITKKVENLNTDPTVIKAIEIENEYEKDINTAIENGHKEGATEKSIEIAKQMLDDNLDIGTIQKYTGLSEEDIRKLATNS